MDLNEYRVFRAIADEGSLVRAASLLGVPRSTVSKRLADLEKRLGRELFKRTTRRVALTSAGAVLLESVSTALDLIGQASDGIRAGGASAFREIIVSAPPVLAQNVVGNVVGELLRGNPRLRIEVRSKVDHDPARDSEVDIRMSAHPVGRPPSGSTVVGVSRRGIYAAPSFLSARSQILRPHDVPPEGLVMRQPAEELTMARGRRRATLICDGPLRCIDHETVRDAVATGAFLGVLPRFIALPLVRQGRLVEVLPEWRFPDIPIVITIARHARQCPLVEQVARLMPPALAANGLLD